MGWSLLIGGVVMWIVDAMNAKSEAAGPSAGGGRIHTWKMEAMQFGSSDLDWLLPNLLGRVSGNVALHVDYSWWTARGNVASRSP